MTDKRFNELLSGPLHHPFAPFTLTRLVLALRVVLNATGEAGEKALEDHCRERDEKDRLDAYTE